MKISFVSIFLLATNAFAVPTNDNDEAFIIGDRNLRGSPSSILPFQQYIHKGEFLEKTRSQSVSIDNEEERTAQGFDSDPTFGTLVEQESNCAIGGQVCIFGHLCCSGECRAIGRTGIGACTESTLDTLADQESNCAIRDQACVFGHLCCSGECRAIGTTGIGACT